MRARVLLARLFRRWATTAGGRSQHRRERWLRLAARTEPVFSESCRDLFALLTNAERFWEAVTLSQEATNRFAESADAWVMLGEAWDRVYRYEYAVQAFEHAFLLEARPDTAMASGRLLRQLDRHRDAAARFAFAYANGGGLVAMHENARSLRDAGDDDAARAAERICENLTREEDGAEAS